LLSDFDTIFDVVRVRAGVIVGRRIT